MRSFDKYSDFENALLIAAYHLSNSGTDKSVLLIDIQAKFSMELNQKWVEEVISHFWANGLSKERLHNGPVESQRIWLTRDGIVAAERLISSGFDVESTFRSTQKLDFFPDAPLSFDSQAWTGRRLASAELQELATSIDSTLSKLDELQLPQHTLAQARSYLLAARALTEAPDPPINIISWLLAHFDRIVGITGLLVGIASLVGSWTT